VLVPRFAGLVALICVVAAGAAVASSARPDTHVYDYHPIRTIATGIERVIPPGRTIAYRAGPLDVATQPIEPAVRFLLVRHGLRPLADGALPRLGTYYIEDHRTVQWIVHLLDGTRRPRGMRLLARASFTGPWGPEVLSAWARQVVPAAPTASAASTALAASTVPPAP
jgi:hypothetical protein